PRFNMTLWTTPFEEFEAALGLSPGLAPAAAAPQDESHQGEMGGGDSPSRYLERSWLYAVPILLLLLVAARVWPWNGRTLPPQASLSADSSVAVMPFVNMSGDPVKEYLGDGIAEELLNDLSNTPHLQVASRTSSFSFKGKNADI